MGWIGDPIWLEEVLRPALGERLRVLDGWRERGHGDFRDIRGVMWHHTGNSRETAKSIARGRPDLPGPLANLHISAQRGRNDRRGRRVLARRPRQLPVAANRQRQLAHDWRRVRVADHPA